MVDFGIAKAADTTGTQLTRTGMIVGTPEFMSPEQVVGEPLDARSDVYALALVAFQMLAGVLPFTGATPERALMSRLMEDPQTLAAAAPDVNWPEAVQAVLTRALIARWRLARRRRSTSRMRWWLPSRVAGSAGAPRAHADEHCRGVGDATDGCGRDRGSRARRSGRDGRIDHGGGQRGDHGGACRRGAASVPAAATSRPSRRRCSLEGSRWWRPLRAAFGRGDGASPAQPAVADRVARGWRRADSCAARRGTGGECHGAHDAAEGWGAGRSHDA
jgi:hypothetical protein